MARVSVIGLGRIGLRLAWELVDMGHEVVGVDANTTAADRAERLLGIETRVVDVTRTEGVKAAVRGVDAAAVALPGRVGYRALRAIAGLGVDAVDVSFSPWDPYESVDPPARNTGATIVVDAGVAPGLSNLLVGLLARRLSAREARILVGGVSGDPDAPLGLSATWSVEDLVDEYLRKARAIIDGRLVEVDPLSRTIEVDVPGVGRMEAIPTDGLRTMLRNLRRMRRLEEYTLRWPGHVRVFKEMLHLGLLDDRPVTVGGCSVSPRSLLSRMLEYRLASRPDLLVLVVEARGERGSAHFISVSRYDGGWSAMARATAGFQAAVTNLLVRGRIRGPGVIAPEELAPVDGVAEAVLGHLEGRGIPVELRPGLITGIS